MNRRRFIRLSAFAGASAAVRPDAGPLLRGMADPVEAVVVVGAGLAGLRAADLLRKAGREVVVLEARSHPGGRVQTIRQPFDDGLFGEAGPIRIKSTHRKVLGLARELGLTLVPFAPPTGSPLVSIHGVSVRSDEPLDAARLRLDLKPEERGLNPRDLLEHYVGDVPGDLVDSQALMSHAAWQAADRLTWPEWLRARGASAGAIRLMTIGGESNELSALYVLRQIALLRNTGPYDFKISGGMDRLPRMMASALGDVIRYNTPVVRIDREADRVKVNYTENAETKRVEASRIVFTVPFSTLRQIEIRPPLSRQKERAIEDLPYFPVSRFLVQSRTRFWRASGLSGYARTDRPAEIWDCTYDLPGPRGILGGNAGGDVSRAVLNMGMDESVAFGKALIAQAHPDIDGNFEKGVAHRWALEPWSRGAFAVFHPGQMSSTMPHIASPEGRVHFAGEHTSPLMGWMEGALESGERVAQEVMTSTKEA